MSLTDKLVSEYKRNIESLTLIPSDKGRFEVTIGEELVYSKLETGEFPTWERIRTHAERFSGR